MSHQLDFMTGMAAPKGEVSSRSSLRLLLNLNNFIASELQHDKVLHQLQWESDVKALVTVNNNIQSVC